MDVSMTLSVISIVLSSVSMIFGILGFSFALAAKMSTHRVQYVDPFQEADPFSQETHSMQIPGVPTLESEGWALTTAQINEINKEIDKTERAYDEDNLMEMI